MTPIPNRYNKSNIKPVRDMKLWDVPREVDWRINGKVSRVKN